MEQIIIKNFATEIEAELAKNLLRSQGIKCMVQMQGVSSSGIPNDRFGADLVILKKDTDRVTQLLGITNEKSS